MIFLMISLIAMVDVDAVIVMITDAIVTIETAVTTEAIVTEETAVITEVSATTETAVMTEAIVTIDAAVIVDVTTTGEDSLTLAGRRDFTLSLFLSLLIHHLIIISYTIIT